jgi:hypothetical protein
MTQPTVISRTPQFKRVAEKQREKIMFFLDSQPVVAFKGDTILTAILTHQSFLRESEMRAEPRAGFCLIGACQDCWISLESGARLRACTSLIAPDMRIVTTRGQS